MQSAGRPAPAAQAPTSTFADAERSQPGSQKVISELCDGRVSSPSEQVITVAGHPVRQPCGLVALEFEAAAFTRFATTECQESADSPSTDCYRRWYGAFISRVLQRYTYADLKSFPVWCEAHSSECDDLRAAEMWFLHSHSSGVHAAYQAHLDRVRAQ